MLHKRLEEILKSDVDSLTTDEARESRRLDYKLALPGGSDEEKKEFLADVTSFANAGGGFIVYGIEEKRDSNNKPTGIPQSASGLGSATNLDAEILRLENILRTSVDPRIPVVQFKEVSGFAAGSVLVLRVGQSWSAPHMMTFKGASRFYSRNSAGKYQLDVREIRAAFLLSESVPERIRRFRDERLAKIVADETPVALVKIVAAGEKTPTVVPAESKLLIHILPFGDIDASTRNVITPDNLRQYISPPLTLPVGAVRELSSRFNFDGLLVHDRVIEMANTPIVCRSYAQIFRNGAIEAVEMLDHPLGKFISEEFEPRLISVFKNYLYQLKELNVEPPLIVMISLTGVKGYRLWLHEDHLPSELRRLGKNQPFDKDTLLLPELIVEDLETATAEDLLRPAFDALWQAGGWARCLRYNDTGEWTGRR